MPQGIDIYFDNVGGDILDAALARLAMRGRVVLCGAIAQLQRDRAAAGPKNYINLIVKRGRMEGFIVLDYLPRARRRSASSPAGCRPESSRTRSTCSTAWRTRRRRCGVCSKVATRASSSCVLRSENQSVCARCNASRLRWRSKRRRLGAIKGGRNRFCQRDANTHAKWLLPVLRAKETAQVITLAPRTRVGALYSGAAAGA